MLTDSKLLTTAEWTQILVLRFIVLSNSLQHSQPCFIPKGVVTNKGYN